MKLDPQTEAAIAAGIDTKKFLEQNKVHRQGVPLVRVGQAIVEINRTFEVSAEAMHKSADALTEYIEAVKEHNKI